MPRPRNPNPPIRRSLKLDPKLDAQVVQAQTVDESFNATVERLLSQALDLKVKKGAIVPARSSSADAEVLEAIADSVDKQAFIASETRRLAHQLPHSIARREAEKAWRERN